jgi:hypothetical protein
MLNRLVLRPLAAGRISFFASWGNDLLCIPFWLPLCLRVYRAIGLRVDDGMPTRFEVLSHLIVWALCFEWLFPWLSGPFAWMVADAWDTLAYAVGAAAAGTWWGTWSVRPTARPHVETMA